MRRCAVALVVAAMMGLLPAPARADLGDQIQGLLDARAQAVRSENLNAFLATIDPGAADFRERQQAWFRRIIELPVEEYSLTSTLGELGEFTREIDRDRHGDEARVIRVDERYRIAGYDERPDLNQLIFTFVSRSGRWYVAGDTALDDLGMFTERQPWDFGNVRVRTSDHFLVVYHPQDDAFSEAILEQAEQGLGQVDRAWPRDWSRRTVIYIPASPGELEGILGVVFDVSNFVAFAMAAADLTTSWDLVGYRVVVNPANFDRYTPEGRREILAHELLHVATRRASGPFVPNWVEEGLAQMAESAPRPDLGPLVASGRFTGKVPEDLRFSSGSGDEIRISYREAASAIRFMADRFGLDKVTRFYERLGAARIEPGTDRYHIDAAMREALGIGLGEFEGAWSASVRG